MEPLSLDYGRFTTSISLALVRWHLISFYSSEICIKAQNTARKKKKSSGTSLFSVLLMYQFCAQFLNLRFFSSPKNASLKWFLSRCEWLIPSGAISPSLICYTLETGVLMLEIYTSINYVHCGRHFRPASMSTLPCLLVHGRVMFLWSPLPLESCDEFWKWAVSVFLPIQNTLDWGKIPQNSLLG